MNKLVRAMYAEASKDNSPIRVMFDEGIRLKKEYGEDAVCDFSIGNPDVPAPSEVSDALSALSKQAQEPMMFGYSPYAGEADVLELMSEYLSCEQGTKIEAGDIVLCAGAAGAMCNIFNACLEPGEQVLGAAPYFGEYNVWCKTFGASYKGVLVKGDFNFDLPAIEAAITSNTRVFVYNSPHNPTGHIYGREQIIGLIDILRKKGVEYGRPILLVADEPYRFLVYGDENVASPLNLYENSCIVSSFAKSMSLAGERIGYVAVSRDMPDKVDFLAAIMAGVRCISSGAPTIGQKLLRYCLGKNTDKAVYARRRDVMAEVLHRAGYQFNMPAGAFYFFPKAPGGDDFAFVRELLKHRVLAVHGSAFGMPGYFRLTFCVNEETIQRSYMGFKKAREAIEGK